MKKDNSKLKEKYMEDTGFAYTMSLISGKKCSEI